MNVLKHRFARPRSLAEKDFQTYRFWEYTGQTRAESMDTVAAFHESAECAPPSLRFPMRESSKSGTHENGENGRSVPCVSAVTSQGS